MHLIKDIEIVLDMIRKKRGIVHHITNRVTIHECANAVLAIGASPIMASHREEAYEVTSHSQSVVWNIGTIESGTLEAMIESGKAAQHHTIPIVFDPVGVGATSLRRYAAKTLLNAFPVAVIRCNTSELIALYSETYTSTGVDSVLIDKDKNYDEIAKSIALQYHTVVAVTGPVDIVTDGKCIYHLYNGVDLLPKLTGTGCMTTSLVGAFLTVTDPIKAAILGISYMSISGEIAKMRLQNEEGLGSFSIYLHDALSTLTGDTFLDLLSIK